jgi:hypothetical protein
MSDNAEKPGTEDTSLSPRLTPAPPDAGATSGPEVKLDIHQTNPTANGPDGLGEDPREVLKQRLEETCLPADLREQILAELPTAEEMERLFRELQEQGGLSSEEFFASLGLEPRPKP